MDVTNPLFRSIARLLVGVLVLNPLTTAAANLSVDQAAGGNTQLTQAANGVPVVNIATPNGNGLSHNKFTDYNVDPQGLILNNSSAKFLSTQQAGVIFGNPNLNGQAANLILNEVTGGNPSQLNGYTEVAGQQAHVVVANPHGISCNGCGFINTPRVTLSTGTPQIDNGRLSQLQVSSGEISIEGAGLNAGNVDQFDLVTRSARINAELHANQLNIITGRNQVDLDTLQSTALADDGSPQPLLAIDSSALGGMYAGAIRLVGTEAGVGVRLAGDLAASAGDIQIDANGQLSLARTSASNDLTLNATEITLGDDSYSANSARLTAQTVNNQKNLTTGGNLQLDADEINNAGTLQAGILTDESSNPAAVLSLNGGTLNNQGQIIAEGALNTDLSTLNNQGATLVSRGDAGLKTGSLQNTGGSLIGQQALTIDAGSLDNQGGTLASNQELNISVTGTLDNDQDGLILSQSEGLTLNTNQLNNDGGVIQASEDTLTLTANQLSNQQGQISAGDGALEIAGSSIDNRQGQISAHQNRLKLQADSLDNSDGSIEAASITLTAATQLTNDRGRISAISGDQEINGTADISNQSGALLTQHNLAITGQSLDNQGGTLGAETIELNLSGALNNDGGLIESNTSLALNSGTVSNANGKLRALGNASENEDKSQFSTTGQFNNDNGLIEIGNAQFSLTSQGLSNQQGILRHLGNEQFAVDFTDLGQAGGAFYTETELTIDLPSWVNTSLLQAKKLTLQVDNLIQSATAKLVSQAAISANGNDWQNDGQITSDNAIALSLSGDYQGDGDLLSQDALNVTADNISLGSTAELRSQSNTQLAATTSLTNLGTVTSGAALNLNTATLNNQGTLGAAEQLTINSTSLTNENGLLYSGTDMQLYTDNLLNRYADIFSLGALEVSKNDSGAALTRFENRSGSIEASGDITLVAQLLENTKDQFSLNRVQTYGNISVTCYDCSGDHHNVDYVATERFTASVSQDSAASNLHSGANLTITAGTLNNHYSTLSAVGDIDITATTLENLGAATGDYQRVRRFNTGRITDGTDYRFRGNYINPYNTADLPKEIPTQLYSSSYIRLVSDTETQTGSGAQAPAIIQAGGNVRIQATQSIENASILDQQSLQNGTAPSVDTDISGGSEPLVVTLNAQRGPDSNQNAVNPLDLPSFSLPSSDNGLFRLSSNPDHPYLIETQPEFASLRNFLSSDYLLGEIGYDDAETQRRLGDGLYEQRLIQQAVAARTGKRFLAGLSSDEAQFRYLMDNAIASKQTLNLSLGVALSAEQVAALTHDIVWMQEQEVNGVTVLVPVLYLAQADDRLAPSGALIEGQDIALISGGELSNSGTLRASQNLAASANNIENSGLIQANERLDLLALDSISNNSGVIAGDAVSLTAVSGDISNERRISQEQRSGAGFSQLTSVVDSGARIESASDLILSAGRDIKNIGSTLVAEGNALLEAGGDLIIAAAKEEQGMMREDKRHHWTRSTTTQHGSSIEVGGDLSARAGGDLVAVASKLKADGDIDLAAGGDTLLMSAANENHSAYRYRRSDKKLDIKNSKVRQQATEIEAGGALSIQSGGDMQIVASELDSGKEAYLYAGGDLELLSSQDRDYSLFDLKEKGSWGKKKTQRDEVTDIRHVGSEISASDDLTLASEGDQHYQKARLESGGDLTLESGGSITFEAVKDLHQESHEESDSDWSWTSAEGKGQTDETVLQSQLIAQGQLAIRAAEGLQIDIKQIDQKTISQTIDAMVQADPQLAWLKEAEQRGDVDWRRVEELHNSFKYSHSGMGAGTQLVVAIVVTYFTAGWASGAIGGAAGAGAGSGSALAAGGTVAGTYTAAGWGNMALTAVATGAASNASISAINNQGDLGAVFDDVTSEDALRGYTVAGVTAGLTSGLFNEWTGTETGTSTALPNSGPVTVPSGLSSLSGVGEFASNQLLQNSTSTLIDRALGGDSEFGDALRSSLANTFSAAGFNLVGDIGDTYHLADGGMAKIGLHALMGGLAAEAAGGDFKTGALAAGVNEALVDNLAQQYSSMPKEERDKLLVMNSQLLGVLTAAAQGGDDESYQVASGVAGDATQYNYLNHQDVEWLKGELDKCGGEASCERDLRGEIARRSNANNERLSQCGQNNTCIAIAAEIREGGAALAQLEGLSSNAQDMVAVLSVTQDSRLKAAQNNQKLADYNQRAEHDQQQQETREQALLKHYAENEDAFQEANRAQAVEMALAEETAQLKLQEEALREQIKQVRQQLTPEQLEDLQRKAPMLQMTDWIKEGGVIIGDLIAPDPLDLLPAHKLVELAGALTALRKMGSHIPGMDKIAEAELKVFQKRLNDISSGNVKYSDAELLKYENKTPLAKEMDKYHASLSESKSSVKKQEVATNHSDTGVTETETAGVPGIDKPFRQPNPDFPPNADAMEMMGSDAMKKYASCTSVDCGELADKLYDAAGGKGKVLRIESPNGKDINTPEIGGTENYVYHEIYTDGQYVFDPRLSETPIPKGDYMKLIKSLNPDGLSIFQVQ